MRHLALSSLCHTSLAVIAWTTHDVTEIARLRQEMQLALTTNFDCHSADRNQSIDYKLVRMCLYGMRQPLQTSNRTVQTARTPV